CRRAAALARAAVRRVALLLSHPLCVDRHRDAFLQLLRTGADIVIGNEAEFASLYRSNDLAGALAAVRRDVRLAAVTLGEAGSLILEGAAEVPVPAAPTEVVDTTGAGDAYAAGFLTALTAGRSLAACGQLGALAAAEVISHLGARLQRDLRAEIAAADGPVTPAKPTH
ncbi:MAG: adenosine kinase, partial [Alphaproteobacteria bacterium]|nr:adenosine kinase [Alphaproteobacteria bacterium]